MVGKDKHVLEALSPEPVAGARHLPDAVPMRYGLGSLALALLVGCSSSGVGSSGTGGAAGVGATGGVGATVEPMSSRPPESRKGVARRRGT